MCGIVGIIGNKDVAEALLEGLGRIAQLPDHPRHRAAANLLAKVTTLMPQVAPVPENATTADTG